MALKGKIDDFGITEIFQLISQQQRSGTLTIKSEGKAAEVIFFNGMVFKAIPFYVSSKRDPFSDTAFNARLVDEEGLQKALEKQEESFGSMEDAFFDLALLNQKQIQKINYYLVQETLYETLQWKTGEYEFSLKEVEYDEKFINLLPIEHILLDVLRMIDEEPEISRRITHNSLVFQKTTLKAGLKQLPEELGDDEKTVFKLVDGNRTVQDIIYQSLLGRYNTNKALVNLLDERYIRKVSAPSKAMLAPAPKKNTWAYIAYGVSPLLIILLLLGLRLIFFSSPAEEEVSYKIVLAKIQTQKISKALDVYFLKKGTYPDSLQALVKEKILPDQELHFPLGSAYHYQLQDDGSYQLKEALSY